MSSEMKHAIYTVGGTVQAGGGFYLSRRADDELLNLCRQGAFAYILTARQMGKSSLMVRTANRLATENIRSVMIDLTQIGTQVTPEQWYLGLLAVIEDQLSLSTDAVAWWKANSHFGITQRMIKFFEEVLLKEVAEPVVVFVDEIDTTLGLNFTDDFYAAIRYLYNARAVKSEFKRLSFTLVGVATPGDLIRDPQRTPFNIGQRVDLGDFTYEEAAPLAEGLKLPPGEARQALRWAMKWTNGHPYLTQRLCMAMVEARHLRWTEADVDRVVADAFFGAMSEQDNNLQFVRDMLIRRAPDVEGALKTYGEIRAGNHVRDEEQSLVKSHLKLSGVVRREGAELRPRNRIYETVFDEQWVKDHLPVNWRKRARYAAAALLAAFMIFSPALTIYAWKNSQLEKALAEARQARDEAVKARESEAAQRKTAESNATEARRQSDLALASAAEAERQRRGAQANATEAQQQRNLAQSGELAATSSLLAPVDPDLSLSLLNEATRRARTSQAEDAFRQFLLETSMRAVLRGHSEAVRSAAYSPDGRFIVTASWDKTARVWDASTAQPVAELKGHSSEVNSASYSPDGRFIVTASRDKTARVWNASSALPVAELKGHSAYVYSAAYSPDGRFIVTASADGTARVWNASTAEFVAELKGHSSAVISAAYSPDGKFIVTASDDRTARVWDASTAKLVAELKGHLSEVWSAAYSPDGRLIVTASADGTARVWNASTAEPIAELKGHSAYVYSAAYSPDGKFIITVSADGTARIWNASTSQLVAELKGHSNGVLSAAYSPDGRFIVTASWDKTARVWDASSSQFISELKGHSANVNSAAYSPDGRFIVTASDDRTARVWNASTAELVAELKGHSSSVISAAYSPDGRFIVTASDDRTARVWNASTTEPVAELKGHSGTVRSAAYSPDGRFIVTVGDDSTARVWNASTAQSVAELKGHSAYVNSAAYSPDGRFIVTVGDDRTARIWNASTAEPVAELKGHSAYVNSAAYSPDGRFIVTVSGGQTTRIYPRVMFMPFDELMELARKLPPRRLTPEERERYLHEPRSKQEKPK
jgi:WD40 repeat protein